MMQVKKLTKVAQQFRPDVENIVGDPIVKKGYRPYTIYFTNGTSKKFVVGSFVELLGELGINAVYKKDLLDAKDKLDRLIEQKLENEIDLMHEQIIKDAVTILTTNYDVILWQIKHKGRI